MAVASATPCLIFPMVFLRDSLLTSSFHFQRLVKVSNFHIIHHLRVHLVAIRVAEILEVADFDGNNTIECQRLCRNRRALSKVHVRCKSAARGL